MGNKLSNSQLMIPVYINEKVVLDMLAIIEDGFSMVSQVNSSEQRENEGRQTGGISATSNSIINKLLKIDFQGELSHMRSEGENINVTREKVHTNVSLLSKFRKTLKHEKLLHTSSSLSEIRVGDFIEFEGELKKNPLIECIDKLLDMFRMAKIFAEQPELGNKKEYNAQKRKDEQSIKQVKDFLEELKHSGTVDFILSHNEATIVLSAQEQYLANDNVSEILGGSFKVLGKVIAICEDDSSSINLLRKTSLSILTDEMLSDFFGAFNGEDMQQFVLPELVTRIDGPAMIVIPIAIYA